MQTTPTLPQIKKARKIPIVFGKSYFKKSRKKPILLPFLIVVTAIVFATWLLPQRKQKMETEIKGIQSKQRRTDKLCEQYALVALAPGWFPCYNCGIIPLIYLNKNEVWKYGKTCNEENGRYPNGLPNKFLIYRRQFTGTETECLIEEKRKIYNYPALPECLNRHIKLIRPPGNKIDR